jgi:glycosyltransferase involved in cell wall biosynthesis
VVIPAHNAASFLPAAIASIQRQAVAPSDLEIIVVDDGSTDDTAEVMASMPDVIYRRQARAGAARARNAGVDIASNTWLSFLDADDVWDDTKIVRQWAALDEQHTDMVFGCAREFQSNDPADAASADRPLISARCAGTLLMTRSDFLRVGPFTPEWRVGEFIDWYLRAVDLGLTASMLDEVVLYRRLHADNAGRTAGAGREDYVRIIKSALDRRRGA